MGQAPTHDQLANDYNTPFRGKIMLHVHNHIGSKRSGHYVLRETLLTNL